MGLFTKASATPPAPPANQAAEEALARLGLTRQEFQARVSAHPALRDALTLVQWTEKIGIMLTAAYVTNDPASEAGQECLSTAGLVLLACGAVAENIITEIQGDLQVGRV